MSDRKHRHLAFGVEPNSRKYRLRLARYQALAETIAELARERSAAGGPPLKLLDAGAGNGRTFRYLEPMGVVDAIAFHALEYDPHRIQKMYARERWASVIQCDLTQGVPHPDGMFDVVICEQVLEHLDDPAAVIRELVRVLRPGGTLIIGVPTFPGGIAWLRRHLVPRLDAMLGKDRGHAQVFTTSSLRQLIDTQPGVKSRQARGFRIVSGGLLGFLENYHGWYRLNRRVGEAAPSLCIETQVLATKQR